MTVEIGETQNHSLDNDVAQISNEIAEHLKFYDITHRLGDVAAYASMLLHDNHFHQAIQRAFDLNPLDYIDTASEPFSVAQQKKKYGGAVIRSTFWLPDNPRNDRALLIGGGFGAPEVAYMDMAAELARRGYTVGTWSPPRAQSLFSPSSYKPAHMADPLLLQSQAGYATWKGIQQESGAQHVDILGHSMGFLIAQKVASRVVEQFPSGTVNLLISDAGAGLDGPGSFGRHLKQVGEIIEQEVLAEANNMYDPEQRHVFMYHAIYYLLRSPVRLLREGAACVIRPDATETIPRLKEKGASFVMITAGNDAFFDEKDVLKASAHLADLHVSLPGAKHVEPNIHGRTHAAVVDESIQAIEALGKNHAA